MEAKLQLSCWRCGHKDVRALAKRVEGRSVIKCRHCGYVGHWREFIDGHAERKAAIRRFEQGDIESNTGFYK